MPIELHPKEALINAALMTRRPVAFLVGSPLSLKDGVGVPGITTMLDFVRDEVRDRNFLALPQLDSALSGISGADGYQAAMKWLGINAGQDAVNEVIAKAVLQARKAGTVPVLPATDGVPGDWNIPAGTAGLAELVARGGEKFLGPVLTTNFDPLISLAVRKSGGRAGRRVLTSDGTLAGPAEDEPGICNVVHLHGFWRDSDTLHTQAQLTNPRPKLVKSLQRLLVAQQRTLIVAAYGGWDDVFTSALVDLMNDEQAKLDVIWCFYESDPIKVKEKYGKLLKAVAPALAINRFRAFGGIDCHTIFSEILAAVRGVSPTSAVPVVASPLAGWELIDASYLSSLSPLRPEEVVRYFDGATPTWRHAACVDIPSRAAVGEIARRLAAVRDGKAGCSLQLIRSAGGEGKTTLLLQAAAAAATSGGWNVLWRPAPRLGLPPEHVTSLDPSKHWLIVADDAENLVRDLGEAARLLHEGGRSHIHFLLAARDTDWRYFHGDRQPWRTMLTLHQDILLRELRDDDANILVGAWQKYGSEGLRQLASLPSTDRQVAALLNAVHGAASARDEGSFFGGLLAVRFGPDGLRNHVVSLLTRLKDERIENSGCTLFDALLYVAACHAVGIPGLDENVLADLVGVSRDWVQTLVVNPLGEEAAAVLSAGHVLTRHNKVAAAILVAAEQDLGADIAEIWSALVRQTVHTSLDVRIGKTYSPIVHAGPRLQRELPQQFSEQRRKEIAIAAAKSAVQHQSMWMGCITDLAKTYRISGDLAKAVQVNRENFVTLQSRADYTKGIRGYWYEWGGCEGRYGGEREHALRSAWVCGLSLADFLNADLSDDQIKLSCAGTGVAFGNLAKAAQSTPFALGLRATAFLGLLANPDEKGARFFKSDHRNGDKMGTPYPQNIEEAVGWLTTAVAQAGRELQDPFLKALLKPEQVSFNMLREFLTPAPPPRPRAKQHAPRPTPKAPPVAQTPFAPQPKADRLYLWKEHEERFKEGIERVLSKAWSAVPADTPPEDRFEVAYQSALEIISGLSRHIRHQVRAHFNQDNWESLRAREPKP